MVRKSEAELTDEKRVFFKEREEKKEKEEERSVASETQPLLD